MRFRKLFSQVEAEVMFNDSGEARIRVPIGKEVGQVQVFEDVDGDEIVITIKNRLLPEPYLKGQVTL